MSQGLSGKYALVTGAAGGIGQSLVAKLRAEGVKVAATDISLTGVEAEALLAGDLCDPSFCDRLPQQAQEALGGLDIVINNAGIIRRGKITQASDEDYRLSMAVNVEAPFRLCRAAIPLMAKRGGGAIVNTASCWGLYPGPDHPIYVMSKAAIASLTQCLGRDHASQNIRVNAVCPNEVNTPMLRTGFSIRGLNPDQAISELNHSVPLGRIAEPEDIADVILFLASDQARYICGALVEVNGGKPVS
ncbi:MAG: SDR family NAD(P)-dependent oxidoreductase [Paracoccaceae bacterium]